MRLIIFNESLSNLHEFIDFWSGKYQYPLEHLYDKNIGKPFTPAAVNDLFRWKNGTPLSGLKERSVKENFIDRIHDVLALSHDLTPEAFLQAFPKEGAIWRIFWMHCWKQSYPIYDQHVHRAMAFIQGTADMEISGLSDAKKVEQYQSRYIPFVRDLGVEDGRKADQALWAFGKFIKAWTAPDRSTQQE